MNTVVCMIANVSKNTANALYCQLCNDSLCYFSKKRGLKTTFVITMLHWTIIFTSAVAYKGTSGFSVRLFAWNT